MTDNDLDYLADGDFVDFVHVINEVKTLSKANTAGTKQLSKDMAAYNARQAETDAAKLQSAEPAPSAEPSPKVDRAAPVKHIEGKSRPSPSVRDNAPQKPMNDAQFKEYMRQQGTPVE